MLVIFAIVLPLLLIIGSMVVSIGSWYTHAQASPDQGRRRGVRGRGSWGFPCAADSTPNIEDIARQYVGST